MSALLFALLVPDPAGSPRTPARDRLADAVAAGLAIAYGALMIPLGDAMDPGAALPWPADVAVGVLCCLALVLRRHHPIGLTLALIPAATVSVMATGAVIVALFTVTIRRPTSAALLLAAGFLATAPVYFALQAEPRYPLWVDLVMRVVTSAAALGWGMFVRAYRRLTASLREHAARLEAEQHLRIDQARLTERTRIAREMHDVLAHRMSLVSLHAGALEVRTDARPEEVALAAGAIRASAHAALQELRAVIGVLRESPAGHPLRASAAGEPLRAATGGHPLGASAAGPPADDPLRAADDPFCESPAGRPERPQPGLADVPELVASALAAGTAVDYTCAVPVAGPSAVLGRTAYRLVQEGLTNARKHAPGTPVRIRLDGSAGSELRIRITNPHPGRAVGPAVPGAGLGLVGVGERVALAGGRVEYGPAGADFRLEAWLPWPA